MGNHRDTAARIWRTIVCSGAMLGVPLAAAADTPQDAPAKQAPAKPAKAVPLAPPIVSELERDLEANTAKIDRAVTDVENAQNEADRTAAKARLTALQREQATLHDALAIAKSTPNPATLIPRAVSLVESAKNDAERATGRVLLQRLAKNDAALVARVDEAVDATAKAKTDPERTAAKTKLAAVQKEVEAKQGRPRATEPRRPIGRGFILS